MNVEGADFGFATGVNLAAAITFIAVLSFTVVIDAIVKLETSIQAVKR